MCAEAQRFVYLFGGYQVFIVHVLIKATKVDHLVSAIALQYKLEAADTQLTVGEGSYTVQKQ